MSSACRNRNLWSR